MSAVSQYAPSFRIVVKGTDLSESTPVVDVLSVSVTETFNQADSFNFMLRDRHPEKKRLFVGGDKLQWIDSDLFDEENEVEIYMGYVDNLHLMLRGVITALNPSFPSSGQPTLTVQGFSLYKRLQSKSRRQPFKSATDSDVAEEIARDVNLTPVVDETEAEHPMLSPQGDTFDVFLRKRAKRIGYEVTVKDRTLYFQQPRYLDKNKSPVLKFEWGRDLVSFSPRLSTYKTATTVTVRGPQTSLGRGKEPLVGTARAGDERAKMGTETGPEIFRRVHGEHHVQVNDHNIASAQEGNQMALACLEEGALEFIVGHAACIGNPELRSRKVIELTGLGKRFSGIYYVTSTTHSIGSDGYRTDFEVKRNAR